MADGGTDVSENDVENPSADGLARNEESSFFAQQADALVEVAKACLAGGETNLENTMLLCSKHHRLMHEGGFTIKKNYQGECYFETAHGRVVASAI